jgi:undecaprenyl-diphosphatase
MGPMILGIFVAFVSAAIAVKWLVSYLTRHGLALFAWYRFVLAGLVIYFLVR